MLIYYGRKNNPVNSGEGLKAGAHHYHTRQNYRRVFSFKKLIYNKNMKILAENKKAFFDYEIYEKFEAGIKLNGIEAKSAKLGRFNIAGSYALIKNNEAWLINSEIQSFEPNNTPKDYDSKRNRKLLLHKSEIKYLIGKLNQKFMLVPLKAYLKNNLIKIELGLAKTRKKIDKRELIKKRETDKKIRKILKKEII